jgi:hypothetical protein
MKRKRLGAIALLFAALLAPVPGASEQVGDLLWPGRSINENLDHLGAILKGLIDLFGKTIDAATLTALQRAMTALQSARVAYSGALTETLGKADDQRSALVYAVANQLIELENFLNSNANLLSDAEQRTNHTLEEITRSSQAPWVVRHEPQFYLPDKLSPIHVAVFGQNLSNSDSRLVIGKTEIPSRGNQANEIHFFVDRKLLTPDEIGFVSPILRMPLPNNSFFHFQIFGLNLLGSAPKTAEYKLLMRKVDPKFGKYVVESEVPSGSQFEVKEQVLQQQNPVNYEWCAPKSDDIEFDPGATSLVDTNAVSHHPQLSGFYITLRIESPAHDDPGPPNSATITTNLPEKLCVKLNLPPTPDTIIGNLKQPITTEVSTKVVYRIRHKELQFKPWSTSGDILWGDTAVELPQGFHGFRAKVQFLGLPPDQPKVFTSPETNGPLQVNVDATSRTLHPTIISAARAFRSRTRTITRRCSSPMLTSSRDRSPVSCLRASSWRTGPTSSLACWSMPPASMRTHTCGR